VALASGELVPIASLVGQTPEVMSLDGLTMTTSHATRVWRTGHQQVWKLKTRSGRTIRATANHKFRTLWGWTALDQLHVGGRVAIPRRYPEPTAPTGWEDARVLLLAHLIGDGCYASRQPIHYTSASPANLSVVEAAAAEAFGIVGRRVAQSTWTHLYLTAGASKWHPNPLTAWLRQLGLDGQRAKQKHVPPQVFSLSDDQLALFIRHLWATDGSIFMRSAGSDRSRGSMYYATASERLASDVQYLLSRLEIHSTIKTANKAGYSPGYQVTVQSCADHRKFAERVGGFGDKARALALVVELESRLRPNTNLDTIPRDVWTMVRSHMRDQHMTQRAMTAARGTSYGGTSHFRFAPSRALLADYASVLHAHDLQELATSDVYWDQVTSIEPDGIEDVYDMTVPDTHNFVANGMVVHNSLEQDADVVLFIYRDEKYNPDTDKKGVADIIVAKHRNGPTGQVQLLFLERTTKFLDLEVFRA
jgi:replicative DNA helicase